MSSIDPSTVLSFDVFFCIFDVLASEDDIESLKACSMACKTFRSLCTRHVFATVSTGRHPPQFHSQQPAIRQLRRLLHRNPALGTYIRRFNLFIEISEVRNPDIPHVLDLLPNVNAFSLSLEYPSELTWLTIPRTLRRSLEKFIQSSSLAYFQLEAFKEFPIASICSKLTHLRDLDLVWAVEPQSNKDYSRDLENHAPIPQLTSFSVGGGNCWKAARLLLLGQEPNAIPAIDFSTLSSLSLLHVGLDEEFKLMEDLLKSVRALETLYIDVCNERYSTRGNFRFAEHIHPSSKKTLKNLRLEFMIERPDEDPYCGACNELSILASDNCPLRSIEIKVVIDTDCTCSTEKEVWGKLDDVLTLSNFPLLRQVTITVVMYTFGPLDSELLDKLLDVAHTAFETPRKQPSVCFEFRIGHEVV